MVPKEAPPIINKISIPIDVKNDEEILSLISIFVGKKFTVR